MTTVVVAAAAGLGPVFAVSAIGFYAIGAVLVAHRRRTLGAQSFGPANAITLARFVIACLFAGYAAVLASDAALDPQFAAAAAIVGALALLMDGLDGWIARRSGTASDFGARFDMEVDAFFILVLSVVAWWSGKAGAWVLLSGMGRYVYLAAGIWFAPLSRPLFASRRRQTVCVIQAVALIVILLPAITSPMSDAIAAIALVLLLYSFAADIRWQIGTPSVGMGMARE